MARRLALIFSVLFFDFFSFSAVIAFLPLFFLETPHTFFSSSDSLSIRYVLLGLLTATYPIAQLLGAPLLGHISDKIGRRGILLCCYFGNMVGYLLCGIGVLNLSIIPLFVGNFIAGMTGVNLSMTNAIISDVAPNQRRPKFFALPQLMLGLGFILGPFVGGKVVAFSSHIFLASFYLFLGCAVVSLINFILISFFWNRDDDRITTTKWTQIQWRGLLSASTGLKQLLFAEFLIFLGWNFFIKTFQVFLIEEVHCTEQQVFSLYTQYGLWFTVSQVAFITWLHKQLRLNRWIVVFAGSILLLAFFKNYLGVCLITPLFTFAYAMLSSSLTHMISKTALSNNHGAVMGLHQSVQSLAKVLGPLTAGFLLTLTPLATVIFAPILILFSLILFAWQRRTAPIAPS